MTKLFKTLLWSLAFFALILPIKIYAEETIPPEDEIAIEEEETTKFDFSLWFNENISQHIATFIIASGGTGMALLIGFKVIKGAKMALNGASDLLGFTKEKTTEMTKASHVLVENFNGMIEGKLDPLINGINKNITLVNEAILTITKEFDGFKNQIETKLVYLEHNLQKNNNNILDTNQKIIKMQEIAFLNDERLVVNGFASEIKKVINDG